MPDPRPPVSAAKTPATAGRPKPAHEAPAPEARGVAGALYRARTAARENFDRTMDRWLGEDAIERLDRVPMRLGESGVDPFGLDPSVARLTAGVARFLLDTWFRAEVHGIENIPAGRVLLISNHSGQIPLDGATIGAAMFYRANPPRFIRAMVEKWSATLPFVNLLFSRVGQIVGVPENCIRLLEMEEAVLVFPEGSRGISKTFDHRYQLTEFGLGFMRIALAANAPIVPVAVIGAEEQYVSVADLKGLAKVLGTPAIPVLPQLLIPGGFLPLPTKYRIYFGEPMVFTGDPDDEDAAIEEKVAVVKGTIQSMLNRGLKERKSLFW